MNKTEKSMKVKLRLIFHMERDLLKVESKVLILELLHYPYTTQDFSITVAFDRIPEAGLNSPLTRKSGK
ncbi:hypothetical protein SLEP1_g43031 [Rubroshorea leprosula]|uniref:Uncharacterized protein n=1 Tax=Rubroshorea leprosula TaxID=152421 RepID=A0AAV5LCQ8_9ROSI|nr:hypothetical protein SLEP1_g43031 [Rubroshorea leprosula]